MKLKLYRLYYDSNYELRSVRGKFLYYFCYRIFEQATGIKLKKGECREIKSIKITLGKEIK